jgi:hypothetical protein
MTDPSSVCVIWPAQGLGILGPSFALAWPGDRVPCFGDLLLAIDVAASKIDDVTQVRATLPSNFRRQSELSAAIVRYPARRRPRWTT